jgi:hypothetical protein
MKYTIKIYIIEVCFFVNVFLSSSSRSPYIQNRGVTTWYHNLLLYRL